MREYFSSLTNLVRRYGASAAVVLIITGSVFFAGFFSGEQTARRATDRITELRNIEQPLSAGSVDFAPFWRAWTVINEKFVGNTTTPDQMKVYGAIAGLADSLGDPYTMFFPPVEKKGFDEQISGSFDGVGMEVGMKDDIVTVIAPIKGNPAERAGIKAGDKILKIDDRVTSGMKVEDAVKLIRGARGTTVRLLLFRVGDKDPYEVKIVRAPISVPAVETIKRADGVFIIRVHSFSALVVNQFREALREFVVSGTTKLVIDMRGNPGGYLEAAVDMASWFLPQGAVVVSEDRGKNGAGDIMRSRGYNIFGDQLKLVILIDAGSASASEIFAGALSEHGKATLIGQKSFGKGSVQELVDINSETALKVTIARWLTPKGHSISGNGIEPDIKVEFTKEDAVKGLDPQLERAAQFLKEGK